MATAKKGKVKNQHFVPRCLLRRFSKNDKTTSVFVIGSSTFVRTTGIKTQCAADYYYGHDQKIENDLARLESAFSSAIGDLSLESIAGLTEEDLSIIRAFVHIQAARTPHAAAVQREAYEDLGAQLWVAYAKRNGIDPEQPCRAERFADAQMPIPGAHTVELATKFQDSISDLEVGFIFGEGFLISDHPTLTLNLWRDEHPRFREWPHLGGLLTKGFLYITPIATGCALIVYDKDTYQIETSGGRVAHAGIGDVMALNALQTINAQHLLFDSEIVKPIDIAAALDFRNQIRATEGSGLLPLRPAGIPLSFLRIVDENPYSGWDRLMLPCRDKTKIPT